jgi:hypothetical protein
MIAIHIKSITIVCGHPYCSFKIFINFVFDKNLPNIQTSLAVVNRLKLMLSGAIHLIGNFPFDAL